MVEKEMKEGLIRKKCLTLLKAGNWVAWYPYRVKYRKEIDIFGVFDIVAVKKDKTRFIQLTTLNNISARRRKVNKFLRKNKLKISAEVWGWDRKKKLFKIIEL